MDIWAVASFGLLKAKLLWIFVCMFHMRSFLLGKWVELLSHVATPRLTSWGSAKLLRGSHKQFPRVSVSPLSHPHSSLSLILIGATLVCAKWYCIAVLICIFLMANLLFFCGRKSLPVLLPCPLPFLSLTADRSSSHPNPKRWNVMVRSLFSPDVISSSPRCLNPFAWWSLSQFYF